MSPLVGHVIAGVLRNVFGFVVRGVRQGPGFPCSMSLFGHSFSWMTTPRIGNSYDRSMAQVVAGKIPAFRHQSPGDSMALRGVESPPTSRVTLAEQVVAGSDRLIADSDYNRALGDDRL